MSPFAIRGVIEGFYGRPWSWAERSRMVDFMGRHGYNLFVYAAKNDPIHRNRWLEPYLPEELERFATLARRCEPHGIEFCFGISPLQYHYGSEASFDRLWEKLMAIYAVGIRSFTILLDDMPDTFHHPADATRFGTIGQAQVWLNNRVLERLEALGGGRLIFCPTEYCGVGISDYLAILGEGLRPEIDIFWTGTEICAQYLKTADARVVSESLKRPVLYWDNYPVNDGEMRFRPHIRPVRGREADLWTACRGIVANGSLQPEATKISLHTYAAYFTDPVGYEPETAWQAALAELCEGSLEDAAAVATLGDMTRWSALERGKQLHNLLAPKLAWFWQAWGGAPAQAGPDLTGAPEMISPPTGVVEIGLPGEALSDDGASLASGAVTGEAALGALIPEFERLKRAAERLQSPTFANRHLQAELLPWAEKLQGWAETGLLALSALSKVLQNPADPEILAVRDKTLERLLLNRENFHWVGGDLIDQFSRRVLWAAHSMEER